MPERAVPSWLPYADLACVTIAAGLWATFPHAGPWPLVLMLAPWVLRLALTGRLSRRTSFDLPALLFLFTAVVGVWAAYDREAALLKLWQVLTGLFFLYALVNAESIGNARIWLLGLLGSGTALCFLITHDWDAFPTKIEILTRLGAALQPTRLTLPGPRLHPNDVGNIIAMTLPFAGLAAIQAGQRIVGAARPVARRNWLALGASLLILAVSAFGLLMTISRGAWIAVGVALLLVGLWIVSGRLSQRHPAHRMWLLPGLLVAALVLVLGVGILLPGGPVAALDALPGPNSWGGRAELLQKSPLLARDYPFIGAGLSNFQMLYSTYVLLIHVGFIGYSHNLYLDVAIQQGLPGLLALLWMWLLFCVAVWRGMLQSSDIRTYDARDFPALAPAALSLVIVLIHGIGDDPLYMSEGILFLFAPLAFAVPFLEPRKRRVSRKTGLLLPIGLILLMGVALVWHRPLLSTLYSNLGAVHQSQAELTVYTWPEWPIQDEVRRTVDLSRPVAEFERALTFDPRNATANRRLGMIDLAQGKYEAALGHLETAYEVEPWSETTRQLYGEALIVNGYLVEGEAMWSDVGNAQRQLDIRVFWYSHIGDQEREAWVKEAANSR